MANMRKECGFSPDLPWTIGKLLQVYQPELFFTTEMVYEILGANLRSRQVPLSEGVRGHMIGDRGMPYLFEYRTLPSRSLVQVGVSHPSGIVTPHRPDGNTVEYFKGQVLTLTPGRFSRLPTIGFFVVDGGAILDPVTGR